MHCLLLSARILPEGLLHTLHEHFESQDTNENGVISADELGPLARSVGLNPTASEIETICDEYKSAGGLAFVDFVFLYLRHCVELGDLETTLRTFHLAFQYLDQSSSGSVDKDELRQVMEDCNDPFSERELDDIFQLVDEDCNGYLSYEELYQAVANDLKATLQGPLQLDDNTRNKVREYINSLKRSEPERVSKSPFALQLLVRTAYNNSNKRAFRKSVSESMQRLFPFFRTCHTTFPSCSSSRYSSHPSNDDSHEQHQQQQQQHVERMQQAWIYQDNDAAGPSHKSRPKQKSEGQPSFHPSLQPGAQTLQKDEQQKHTDESAVEPDEDRGKAKVVERVDYM